MIQNPEIICFAGDWHRNGSWAASAIATAAESGAQVLVQCGDFAFDYSANFINQVRHACDEADIDLVFVEGNHDDWKKLNNTWVPDDQGFLHPKYGKTGNSRVHYAPRGHRWTWNDKVFMGLGGAVSVDKKYRVIGSSWWPEETITMEQAEFAARPGDVDVMVCHDLCSSATLPNMRKSSGWPYDILLESKRHRELIQMVVDSVRPELFVHGHFHTRHSQDVLLGADSDDPKWMRVETLDMDSTGFNRNLWFVWGDDLSDYLGE